MLNKIENKKTLFKFLKDYLPENTVFIDLDSQDGIYSVIAHSIKRKCRIFCLEKSIAKLQYLKKIFKKNNITDILFGLQKQAYVEKILSELIEEKTLVFKFNLNSHSKQNLDSYLFRLKKIDNPYVLITKSIINSGDVKQLSSTIVSMENDGFETFLIDNHKNRIYRLTENDYGLEYFFKINTDIELIFIRKEKSISVAFFSHSPEMGGAERSLCELITNLQKYSVFSHIVFPNHQGFFIDTIKDKSISYDIVPTVWWANKRKLSDKHFYDSSINTINYFQELIKINPHIIYTNTAVIPWGALTAYLLNKPHVWHVNEFVEKDHGLKLISDFDSISRIIQMFSNKVIYNSDSVKKEFERKYGLGNGETLYYEISVPQQLSNQDIPQIFSYPDSFKAIILGYITKSKGQDQALKAVKKIITKGLNVELLILGKHEPNDTFYESLVNGLNENEKKRIHFLDHTNNPYPYIKKANVLLVCSRFEALGRVTIEGMLLNKTVIGSDRAGTKELIGNNERGLLYRYGDTSDLVNKIITLYNDRKKLDYFSNKGYKYAVKTFGESKYTQKNYNLFKSIIKKTVRTNKNTSLLLQSIELNGKKTNLKTFFEKILLSMTVKNSPDDNNKIERDNEHYTDKINEIINDINKYNYLIDQIKYSKFFKTWRFLVKLYKTIK